LKGQRRPLVSNAGCAVSDGWSGNGSGMTWPYHVSQNKSQQILSLYIYMHAIACVKQRLQAGLLPKKQVVGRRSRADKSGQSLRRSANLQ
jgi:hypothetical protein